MIQGIIGRKIGMTQVFQEDRTVAQVTAISAGPCIVTQIKRMGKEGYDAIQLGFGEAKRLNSPQKGHLKKVVEDIESFIVGQVIDVSIFKPGDFVDVTGISKGKGFAGVVKRHGFAGGPKTHGQSDRHRAPGSIGATTSPARVFKGKKMAGHMGNERVTVRRLKVVEADAERNLLLVRGSVPGAKNRLVTVRKSFGQEEVIV
jgi:large subunit ribosomal protein L3